MIITRRKRATALVAAFGAVTGLTTVTALTASASHPEASLPGSNFEIDVDANLKQDDPAPSIDWASVTEIRGVDLPTGATDDSYQGGVKEDTVCPGEVTGSIPNNKSDLLTFHGYREEGTPGFFNFAWSRVSDPSGTTLMDFEFNKSSTPCAQGPNVVRTVGDLLVEYAITQGGARADITARLWNGTAWGPGIDLDATTACGGGPCAAGTINQSTIPAAESDGLGEKQPRTFGEAQLDLRFLQSADECQLFGAMMVKSRSSDQFNSQLKDFIRPITLESNECGALVIHKDRKHAADGTGNHPHAGVTFNVSGEGDFVTDANGDICVEGLTPGDFTITETVPTGYVNASPTDTYTVVAGTDCDTAEVASFVNTPLTDIILSVNSQIDGGTASTINCGAGTVSTGPNGDGSTSRLNLQPGTYTCTIVIDP